MLVVIMNEQKGKKTDGQERPAATKKNRRLLIIILSVSVVIAALVLILVFVVYNNPANTSAAPASENTSQNASQNESGSGASPPAEPTVPAGNESGASSEPSRSDEQEPASAEPTEETVPAPVLSDFWIEGSNEGYTNITSVALTVFTENASEARFRNEGGAWSGWKKITYDAAWLGDNASQFNWTISTGDGKKTVEVELRNEGSKTTRGSVSIVLDTVAPVVDWFRINGGDNKTSSLKISLDCQAEGVSQIEFDFAGEEHRKAYKPSMEWYFPQDTADGSQQLVVRFYDVAGNVTEASDSIILDRYREIRVTLDEIKVKWDGVAGSDPGDINYFFFIHLESERRDITGNFVASSGNSTTGDTRVSIGKSETFSLPIDDSSFKIGVVMQEKTPPVNQVTGDFTYTSGGNWGIGSYEEWFFDNTDFGVTLVWTIEQLD
jgi:cytoskeletal protein RodZ